MNTNPTLLIANYAKALLVENDKEKANKYLEAFNSLEKTYPFKGDINCLKDIVKIINQML